MRSGYKFFVLVILTLVLQRLMGLPGAWPIAMALLLPTPWIVGPPLLSATRRWYAFSFFIGLAWDVLFEPVIGPGAIAWSGAALAAWGYGRVVADRSPRSWAVLGALSALLIGLLRGCALYPLGISAFLSWRWLGISMLLTGLWCALVGLTLTINLPQRWRLFRARKLR